MFVSLSVPAKEKAKEKCVCFFWGPVNPQEDCPDVAACADTAAARMQVIGGWMEASALLPLPRQNTKYIWTILI